MVAGGDHKFTELFESLGTPSELLYRWRKEIQTLEISVSGFYAWKERPLSAHAQEYFLLKNNIVELYEEHLGRVGSPSITADLRA